MKCEICGKVFPDNRGVLVQEWSVAKDAYNSAELCGGTCACLFIGRLRAGGPEAEVKRCAKCGFEVPMKVNTGGVCPECEAQEGYNAAAGSER